MKIDVLSNGTREKEWAQNYAKLMPIYFWWSHHKYIMNKGQATYGVLLENYLLTCISIKFDSYNVNKGHLKTD